MNAPRIIHNARNTGSTPLKILVVMIYPKASWASFPFRDGADMRREQMNASLERFARNGAPRVIGKTFSDRPTCLKCSAWA